MLGDDTYTTILLAAADLAERLGDRDLLIAAALAPARGESTGNRTEHALLTVTERALAAIGEDNTPEHVRLLTTLTEQTDARDWRTARDRAFAAIAAARKLGDERLAVEAVAGTFLARSQPDTLAEQLKDTAEAVTTADRLGDPILQFHVRHPRRFALIELGDIEAADLALEEMEQLLGGSQVPLMRYTLAIAETGRHILAADYARAEAAADELFAVMTAANYPDALAVYGGLLFTIRREQGRINEIADLLIDAARDNPGLAVLRATVGIVHCDRDDLDAARASFAGDDDFLDSFPYDFTWMSAMTNLADVAVALGDRDAAEGILRRLEPYANQNVAVAGVCVGSASRPIARLQALLGHDDIADAAFGYALEHNRQLGAPFWVAHTELDYAQALSARGGTTGDQVAALVRSAIDAAREYGFAGLERRAHTILANDGP
jgi:tetratricopeptide (TPR) repeat protein